jgi:proline dehydrogenase
MSSGVRDFVYWMLTKPSVSRALARTGMRSGFAQRFVAGETLEEALAASQRLAAGGRRIILNHLGENVTTEEQARAAAESYAEMLRQIHARGIDGNTAVKLTHLGLDLDRELAVELTSNITEQAGRHGLGVEIDMESSEYTSITIEVFEAVRRKFENVALAIQCYLRRSEDDVKRLAPLHPKLRLVKGAYREPPEVAFPTKAEVDANFARLLDILFEGPYFPAIGTHDPKLVDYAERRIRELKLKPDCYEFQMLYGIRRDLQIKLRADDHPLRIYVPFGTEWFPYFMRRLVERPRTRYSCCVRSSPKASGAASNPEKGFPGRKSRERFAGGTRALRESGIARMPGSKKRALRVEQRTGGNARSAWRSRLLSDRGLRKRRTFHEGYFFVAASAPGFVSGDGPPRVRRTPA